MKYTIRPDACQVSKNDKDEDVPATFEGTVTIDMPKYPVLCQIKRELAMEMSKLKIDKDGDQDKFALAARNMDAEASMFSKLEPLLLEVNLKHLASGAEVKDLETFVSHPLCRDIIAELCTKLMTGFAEKNL